MTDEGVGWGADLGYFASAAVRWRVSRIEMWARVVGGPGDAVVRMVGFPDAPHRRCLRSTAMVPVLVSLALTGGFLTMGQAAGSSSDARVSSRQAPAAFPGDDGKIVFDRHVSGSGKNERRAIWSMTSRGTKLTKLTGNGSEPAWSANGKKIAFVRGGDIYTMKANGKKVRRLKRTRAVEGAPAWSPGGRAIVFDRSGGPYVLKVYRMTSTGKRVRLVTPRGRGAARNPAWSPDGTRIAFANALGATGISTLKPNGTDERYLDPTEHIFPPGRDDSASCYSPNWSPDGKRIVFHCDFGGIFMVTANGKHLRLVTKEYTGQDGSKGLRGYDPAFSPSGKKIVFSAESMELAYDPLGIYTMEADGTHRVRLIEDGEHPDWQPR